MLIPITLPAVTRKRKHDITPGNAIGRTAYLMSKDDLRERWREQNEAWERLRWAREYWQVRNGAIRGTAKNAADSLGMNEHTYRAYERPAGSSKHTVLESQAAIRFGRKFKINWIWLLTGEGTPFDDQLPPAQERMIAAMSRVTEEQQNKIAEMVESLLKMSSPPENAGRTGTNG